MIGKLTTIMVVVKDMERSKKFYGDVLGMQKRFDSPEWTQFDAGSVGVGLHPESERLKVEPHEGMQFGFEVPDIQKSTGDLKNKGVQFVREPHKESFGWLAIFKDPDGHHIQLYQRAA
jgi:lactoylglutathione lyase